MSERNDLLEQEECTLTMNEIKITLLIKVEILEIVEVEKVESRGIIGKKKNQ